LENYRNPLAKYPTALVSRAFKFGYDARKGGFSVKANIYAPETSDLHALWQLGWRKADGEMQAIGDL
jgi:hypothetical protein